MKPKDIEKIRSQIERLKLQNKTELMNAIFDILNDYYEEHPDEFVKDILGIDVSKFSKFNEVKFASNSTTVEYVGKEFCKLDNLQTEVLSSRLSIFKE